MAPPIAAGKHCAGGFTLIELLVVMAILGTLLAIAVPRYFHSLEHSRETVLRHDLSVLRESIDKYAADKGHYPAALTDLVTGRYVRSLPVDPYTHSAAAWIVVASDDPDDPGIKDVHSGAPGNARDGTPYATW